jgi:hypothetical protein
LAGKRTVSVPAEGKILNREKASKKDGNGIRVKAGMNGLRRFGKPRKMTLPALKGGVSSFCKV